MWAPEVEQGRGLVLVSRFRKRGGRGEAAQAVGEILDPHHQRASVVEGGRILVNPAKVFDNIAEAMERVDMDIATAISIEEDVASLDEILSMIESMLMGPSLAVHVVNTAMRIMTPRYPADLVRLSLPSQYDLRKMLPGVALEDVEHDTAKRIFNRRLASDTDLTERDVEDEIRALGNAGQLQVFVALFFMFGNKVGAIQYRLENP